MKHVGKMGRAFLLAAALLLGVLAVPVQAQAAKKVGLSQTSLVLRAGESKKLKLKNAPKGKAVKWSSSKKAVATVSRTGKVTAKKAGEAKVTAAVGKKKYTCTVTVTAADGKNASDVAALKKVIQEQKARGADIPEDLDDSECYVWDKGSLIQVTWEDRGLKGDLSLSGLSGLQFFYCNYNDELTSLDVKNCKKLMFFNCNDNELTSVNVEGCVKLTHFYCSNNELDSVRVSDCPALKEVNFYGTQLTRLELLGCTALEELDCSNMQLTSLSLTGRTSMRTLNCENNELTSLDVSGIDIILELNCQNNELTSLDVNDVQRLNCENNQLTSLNVNDVAQLNCANNKLTSLDVSGIDYLGGLYCQNNELTSLNVNGCTGLTYLHCENNRLSSLDLSSCKYLTESRLNVFVFCDEGVAITW